MFKWTSRPPLPTTRLDQWVAILNDSRWLQYSSPNPVLIAMTQKSGGDETIFFKDLSVTTLPTRVILSTRTIVSILFLPTVKVSKPRFVVPQHPKLIASTNLRILVKNDSSAKSWSTNPQQSQNTTTWVWWKNKKYIIDQWAYNIIRTVLASYWTVLKV